MKFQPGQRVRFLDSPESGVVLHYNEKKKLVVRTDHGFELTVEEKNVVKEIPADEYEINFSEQEKFIRGKLMSDIRKKNRPVPKALTEMEVDLHIYELVESTRNMTNGEMLQAQIRHFKSKLQEAINKKLTKVIFIHGVGEGVLRSEIRHQLRNYENVEVLDGDYKKYGAGATEVRIWYK
jgi:dsDNA-specific endonuclease/ATPase MutS2